MRQPVTPLEIARQVRDAQRGSQAAYAWLYRVFAPLVHTIHLGRAPHAHAEELAQDTFAIAFAQLGQLREAAQFGPWIAAIARRHRGRRDAGEESLREDHDRASPAAGPEDRAEAEHVLRAVRHLPEAYRETLLLRLVEGLSGPEIAALTGLTAASVRVNLHRGMAKLRASLGLAAGPEETADVDAA
ncbi:MAG TPA: sigma-70 family RNA polymerase sigma factor [Dokdonella sp.]|uniref:RNA polymerase sigma factor n=1 Tax=Dokdonella sp. TaxID=2291710 RepID=UPI002BECAFD4|nr:sigma-70 family RNA polymerase sigma factor [Dokdonella sp.]HUD42913.1 sigma-70 family RNA polymerase sigma factor [Dokdonella sp.]